MKEKIIALLLAKFAGVRKDALAQLARTLSLQATTEEEANSLVEKLTSDQVKEFAKEYRAEVDKEVTEANKTFESGLKSKYNFVEKEEGGSGKKPKTKTDDDDDDDSKAPAWAKALIEQNKLLNDKISAFESEKVKGTRLQQLEGKLKDVPDTFKTQKLKDFSRMNFETDDAFNEYLGEVETDITAFNQELANKGFAGQGKPMFGKVNADGVSAVVKDVIDSKGKGSNLSGKEV